MIALQRKQAWEEAMAKSLPPTKEKRNERKSVRDVTWRGVEREQVRIQKSYTRTAESFRDGIVTIVYQRKPVHHVDTCSLLQHLIKRMLDGITGIYFV